MSHNTIHISQIRQDYTLAELDERVTGNDPVAFFLKWFHDAHTAQITDVNAMTLATADADGRPHARIVLLKGVDNGGFTFFTNYHSAKGQQIAHNSRVALLFFWKELERQVRIEGTVQKVSAADSDTYFDSRPLGSRLGAWASPQSQAIADRTVLDDNYKKFEAQFAGDVSRPPHWGGYSVTPECMEFWQGRASRMHDRIEFTRNNTGVWTKRRLAP